MTDKPSPKPEAVIAHQFLALAEIVAEEFTKLGYKDEHAEQEKLEFRKAIAGQKKMPPDQAAIRLLQKLLNKAFTLYGAPGDAHDA